jgi:hypothetical protein
MRDVRLGPEGGQMFRRRALIPWPPQLYAGALRDQGMEGGLGY